MFPLTVENVLASLFIMWLFNQLTFVSPRIKDIVNAVAMVLAIILWWAKL